MASVVPPVPSNKILAALVKVKVVAGPVSEKTVESLGSVYRMAKTSGEILTESVDGAVRGAYGTFVRRVLGFATLGALLNAGPLQYVWAGLAVLMKGLVDRFAYPFFNSINKIVNIFGDLARRIDKIHTKLARGEDESGQSITTVAQDLRTIAGTIVRSVPEVLYTFAIELPPAVIDFGGVVVRQLVGGWWALIAGMLDADNPLDALLRRQGTNWLVKLTLGAVRKTERAVAGLYGKLYNLSAGGADLSKDMGWITKWLDDIERALPKAVEEAVASVRMAAAEQRALWSNLLKEALERAKSIVQTTRLWADIAGELAVDLASKPFMYAKDTRIIKGLESIRLALAADTLGPIRAYRNALAAVASDFAWKMTSGIALDVTLRAKTMWVGFHFGKEAAQKFAATIAFQKGAHFAGRVLAKEAAQKSGAKVAARAAGAIPVVGAAIDVGFLGYDFYNVFLKEDPADLPYEFEIGRALEQSALIGFDVGMTAVSLGTAVGAGVGAIFGAGVGAAPGAAIGAGVGAIIGVVAGIATLVFKYASYLADNLYWTGRDWGLSATPVDNYGENLADSGDFGTASGVVFLWRALTGWKRVRAGPVTYDPERTKKEFLEKKLLEEMTSTADANARKIHDAAKDRETVVGAVMTAFTDQQGKVAYNLSPERITVIDGGYKVYVNGVLQRQGGSPRISPTIREDPVYGTPEAYGAVGLTPRLSATAHVQDARLRAPAPSQPLLTRRERGTMTAPAKPISRYTWR